MYAHAEGLSEQQVGLISCTCCNSLPGAFPRSCGAMSHKTKDCVERPRQKGAKWTNKHIAADEKIEDIRLETFEARRDRWNGYEASEYSRIMDR